MRVLISAFSTDNKYHKQLKQSVEKRGFDITGIPYGRRLKLPFILSLTAYRRNADILHLTWTHPLFLSDSDGFKGRLASKFMAKLLILDLWVCKKLGLPVVWFVHNKHNHEKRFLDIDKAVSRKVASMADGLRVGCPEAANYVEEEFNADRDKISIIPHGNYIEEYNTDIDPKKAREKLGLDKESFVYLFFGQIRPYKNVDEAIDSFNQIKDENAKLVIAGNPLNDEIKRTITDEVSEDDDIVTDLQYIPEEKLELYLNSADVLVAPYEDILSSGTALLAMSFGKPLICPQKGCLTNVLSQQEDLVYSNIEELTSYMKKCRDLNLEKLGKANFESAKEDFSWDEMSEKIEKLYKKVASN